MTKVPNIKIFVAHFNKKGYIYEDDIYKPIQVGKQITKIDLGILCDNTGDNISERNSQYAELTAQYWVWKNYDLRDVDYVGFCHYRRYMTYCYKPKIGNIVQIKGLKNKLNGLNEGLAIKNFNKSILTENSYSVQKFIGDNCFDIFLPKKEIYYTGKILSMIGINNKYINYNEDKYHRCKDKDLNNKLRSLFKEMYIEYWNAYNNSKNNRDEKFFYGNHRHIYIMRKDLFFEYIKRLFDYLFAVEKILTSNKFDTSKDWNGDPRFLGIFSEMLINYFVAYKKEKQITVSNNSNILFFN